MKLRRVKGFGAIAVALVMLGSAAGFAGAIPVPVAGPVPSAPFEGGSAGPGAAAAPAGQVVHEFASNSGLAATVANDERDLTANGRSPTLLHPPNLHAAPTLASTGGHIIPLYSIAPAPMGQGYFGLSDGTGALRSTTVNTTSLAGVYSTGDRLGTQTEEFDVSTGSGPNDIQPSYQSYGAQLNSVLTNVTIFGKTSFYNPNDPDAPNGCPGYDGNPDIGRAPCPNEFWMQNFIEYQPATGEMQIGDEVWNFSNPKGNWGALYSNSTADENTVVGFGSVADGLYFLTNTPTEYGPTIYLAYPFTLVLYENITRGPCHLDTVPGTGVPSCTVDGSTVSMTEPVNEIFMNYSVWKAPGSSCPVRDVCRGNHVCPAVEPYPGVVCGEYDDIFFNSVDPKHPHNGVPEYGPHDQIGSAAIEANGSSYDPVGLPNDFEFDYGIGSDDGDTNAVVYQDGTVGVDYCPAASTLPNGACTRYSATPAASDFGSETGETSIGEVDYWQPQSLPSGAGFLTGAGAPVAHLTTGPALLIGLWNMSGAAYPSGTGSEPLSYVHISPANAWVGVAAGANALSQADFQVAPTFGWFSYWSGSGGSPERTTLGPRLYLSPGMYTLEVLLGGYYPVIEHVDLETSGSAPTIALVRDATSGVYTPLWAFSASDEANISTGPALGTASDPYHLERAPPTVGAPFGVKGSLSWLFSNLNDYLFPVWYGEFLNSTRVYGESNPAPSYLMQYPSWQVDATPGLNFFGVPSTDDLQLYFYHVQNFTLANTAGIYSWSFFNSTPVTSVVCNDCQNVLVAGNSFEVSDRGLAFVGGGKALPEGGSLGTERNVIWGNTFVPDPQSSFTGLRTPSVALDVQESYDRIYNNAFDAYDSTLNATVSSPSWSNDWWNATCQPGYDPLGGNRYPGALVCEPLRYSQSVNGFTLSGSIAHSSYQGGNYWASYGDLGNPYGNIPYKAHRILATRTAYIGSTAPSFAGDYAPLVTTTVYRLTFTERGLPDSSSAALFDVQIFGGAGTVLLWENSSASARHGGCARQLNCVSFYLPDGVYRFHVASATVGNSTYRPHPSKGKFTVKGTLVGSTEIVFTRDSSHPRLSESHPQPFDVEARTARMALTGRGIPLRL